MRTSILAVSVAALYLLHQDLWLWRASRPFVLGILPVGLFYHAVYCLACSGLMWALVRFAWPHGLDDFDVVAAPPERAPGRHTGQS